MWTVPVSLMAEDRVEKFTDIFVKGLGEDLNDEKLKEHFACFGAIVDCKVMVDKYGKNKGYGFVSFKEHDAAEKAVNNAELEGRSIIVSRYLTKAEHKQQRRAQPHPTQSSNDSNLYVKNLDETIDNEALLREFSPYGTITSAKVMMENGRSKKYGFVCFSSPEEAEKAMTEMNGKILLSKPLYVALAQRKAERKAELKARQDAFYIHGRRDIRSQQAFVGNPKYFTPRGSSRFSSPANMYPALPNPILGAQSTGQQPADMSNQANAISRQTNFQAEGCVKVLQAFEAEKSTQPSQMQ